MRENIRTNTRKLLLLCYLGLPKNFWAQFNFPAVGIKAIADEIENFGREVAEALIVAGDNTMFHYQFRSDLPAATIIKDALSLWKLYKIVKNHEDLEPELPGKGTDFNYARLLTVGLAASTGKDKLHVWSFCVSIHILSGAFTESDGSIPTFSPYFVKKIKEYIKGEFND